MNEFQFDVIDTETDEIVRPYNYRFVLQQNGELWTVKFDGSFIKADKKYKAIIQVRVNLEVNNE
jgi:hypothetical protein